MSDLKVAMMTDPSAPGDSGTCFTPNQARMSMETLIASVVALLLFIYLFAAVIRPEKF